MKKNKCFISDQLLSTYLDGECSQDEVILLKDHLQACSLCAEKMDQLQFFHQALYELKDEEVPLPEDFTQRVMAEIDKIENGLGAQLNQASQQSQTEIESGSDSKLAKETSSGNLLSGFFRHPIFSMALAAMLMLFVYLPNPANLPGQEETIQEAGPMMVRSAMMPENTRLLGLSDQDSQQLVLTIIDQEGQERRTEIPESNLDQLMEVLAGESNWLEIRISRK